MGKYDPLESYLRRRGDDEFELSFSEINRIIGAPLPSSASRPQWWANETAPNSRHVQRGAWRDAGYEAFLLPRDRVLFRRAGLMTRTPEPETRWVTPENLTEEQIAEARQALENLIRTMAGAAADASIRLGIEFDMDDPEVARDVMKATFEGLFLSSARPPPEKARARKEFLAETQRRRVRNRLGLAVTSRAIQRPQPLAAPA